MELEFGRRPELVELRDALNGTTDEPKGQTDKVIAAVEPQTIDTVKTGVIVGQTEASENVGLSNPEMEQAVEIQETSPAEFDGQKEDDVEVAGPEVNSSVVKDSEVTDQHDDSAPLDAASGSEYQDESSETVSLDETESGTSQTQAENEVQVESATESVDTPVQSVSQETPESESDNTKSYENFRDELGLSESEDEDDDGYENHYHHAVAYQEMGLMEEAIREFQHAVNAVRPDDGTNRFLNCCTLLGLCFMEKGMPNLGVVWFQKAFESENLTSDEENGIRYELANALEAGGEFEHAMDEFERIYSIDVDFRDVGRRIEQLAPKIPTPA